MTQEMSSRRGWRALGPTNIRLRWSREGIETVLQTFGSAGAGKGSRVLQTFGSAGAGKASRRSYEHSAPLEPGRDRDGPTNIRLRWSREGIESPTNIRLRWSREGIETILQTFGSAGAGKGSSALGPTNIRSAGAGRGSRVLQTFGSAGAGKGSRALDATLRRAR